MNSKAKAAQEIIREAADYLGIGEVLFTFVDRIGQYDVESVGIDPSNYEKFEDFVSALVECAKNCGWASEQEALDGVQREHHALSLAYRRVHES